jgi:hypothetical protein
MTTSRPVPDGAVLTQKCRQQAEQAAAGLQGRGLYGHQLSSDHWDNTAHRSRVSVRYADSGPDDSSGFYVCEFLGESLTSFNPVPDQPQQRSR